MLSCNHVYWASSPAGMMSAWLLQLAQCRLCSGLLHCSYRKQVHAAPQCPFQDGCAHATAVGCR